MARSDSRSRSRRKKNGRERSNSRRSSKVKGKASRSRSRSRSRSGKSRSRSNCPSESPSATSAHKVVRSDDYGVDTLTISGEDAAFILGKGGKTKEKIAMVSGAQMDLDERRLIIEMKGSVQQRRRAMKYAKAVISQRTGSVAVHKAKDNDGDLTIFNVPMEAVGFVTGKNGNFLRTLEDEWTVLMLFAEFDRHANRKYEELAIFGDRRGRRGAELKALSAIEAKCEGFFEQHRDVIIPRDEDEDWGTSTMEFKSDELAYALGRRGATRRKIEASSGCITQYIGFTGIFAGTQAERRRAKEYTQWLFEQLDGPVYVKEWEKRSDCTVLDIPQDCVGYVTGSRRAALGQMEEEFGVLMFFMGSKSDKKESEQLIIFGIERGRLGATLKVKSTVESKAPGFYTKGLRDVSRKTKKLDIDIMYLKDDEISYALGARGSTRKKLQEASGCIIQYIANWAHLAGTRKERHRGRSYMGYLLGQRRGKVKVDWQRSSCCVKVDVPTNCIGWVTGSRGAELRRVEDRTKTFCFLAEDMDGRENMLIFGTLEGSRANVTGRLGAEVLINDLISEKKRMDRGGGRRGRSRSRRRFDSRSPSRRRSNFRRRSPSRRRSSRRRSPSRGRSDSRRR